MTYKALQITQQLKQPLTCDAKNTKTKPTASGSATQREKKPCTATKLPHINRSYHSATRTCGGTIPCTYPPTQLKRQERHLEKTSFSAQDPILKSQCGKCHDVVHSMWYGRSKSEGRQGLVHVKNDIHFRHRKCPHDAVVSSTTLDTKPLEVRTRASANVVVLHF